MERRLAAVLAADVVGYSRLTESDEAGTHARLKAHRAELIDPMIAAHHGRIVKLMGDGALVEFGSVVDAVECAVAIQRGMAERNAAEPEQRRIAFRLGVNLGDVIIEGDDIYGEGVNIAARLQALAEPGGIHIARPVYDQVKNKLALDYEYLGERRVKNIAEPLRVYRVLLAPEARGQAVREARVPVPSWRAVAMGAIIVAVAGLAAVTLWLRPWAPNGEPASVESEALPLPDKPSLAVLPFTNISGDPEQDFFADGMTDDLITDLSKISSLFVIARNSVFTYKDRPVKVQQVSQELGVRYVLEGSVQRAGGRVRINAKLIDATTGHHLWAERYDRNYLDIFALQDEVIGRIVEALAVELTGGEKSQIARVPTDTLLAHDVYLRAERGRHGFGTKRLVNVLGLYRNAIGYDPNFADAYAGIASLAADVWRFNLNEVLPGPVARKSAYEWASRALALDPQSARAHAVLSLIQVVDGHHDDAIDSARKAVSLDPNDPQAYVHLAIVLTYAGRHAEALVAIETALRLDPKPAPYLYADLGRVLFFNRRYVEAIGPLERAREGGVPELEFLAMVYAEVGRNDDAQAAVARLRARAGSLANLAYYRILYAHHKRAEDLELRLDALRKAGVPEWPFAYEGRVEDRLDGSAIEALVFGRTWIGESRDAGPFMKSIDEDGRYAQRSSASIRVGTGSVEGDLYCEQAEALLMGRKACGYIYRNPTGKAGEEFVYVNAVSLISFSVAE